MLEKVVDIDEMELALKNMKNSKNPGTDGIPAEFYKAFWDLVKVELYEAFQDSLQNDYSYQLDQGSLPLLEKLAKDPLFIKNWHPLTYLNVDYKNFL